MAITSYTSALVPEQVPLLKALLEREDFDFVEKPYTHYAAKKGKLNVAVYEKGPKVLVQGKETEHFVEFYLEPEIIGEARLGYEEVHQPEMFEPHFGIDESGKGDYLGPLVIAGVYTNGEITRHLIDAGIQDSKRITSDNRVRALATIIRETPGIAHQTVLVAPENYNRMYVRFGNVNKMLAAGHAKCIDSLARQVPQCPRSLSDQFAQKWQLEAAVKRLGLQLEIEQRTKAESDTAVAAASILAREGFIDWMDEAAEDLGFELPKGAGANVVKAARELGTRMGEGALERFAKMHFKTTAEVL
jgi:ribonuclease HIII